MIALVADISRLQASEFLSVLLQEFTGFLDREGEPLSDHLYLLYTFRPFDFDSLIFSFVLLLNFLIVRNDSCDLNIFDVRFKLFVKDMFEIFFHDLVQGLNDLSFRSRFGLGNFVLMDNGSILERRSHKSVHFFTFPRIPLASDEISLSMFLLYKAFGLF